MSRKEIVLAKKCALITRDWDTFQTIIRTCLRTKKRQIGSQAPSPKSIALHGAAL